MSLTSEDLAVEGGRGRTPSSPAACAPQTGLRVAGSSESTDSDSIGVGGRRLCTSNKPTGPADGAGPGTASGWRGGQGRPGFLQQRDALPGAARRRLTESREAEAVDRQGQTGDQPRQEPPPRLQPDTVGAPATGGGAPGRHCGLRGGTWPLT